MLTTQIIGLRIKEVREGKKISQQYIAEKLNDFNIVISRETLSKIENGNRSVSAIELKAICTVLEVDIDTIIEDNEDESLVTLFRKRNLEDDTIKKVEMIQDMIISFMSQKDIVDSSIFSNVEPLWRQ